MSFSLIKKTNFCIFIFLSRTTVSFSTKLGTIYSRVQRNGHAFPGGDNSIKVHGNAFKDFLFKNHWAKSTKLRRLSLYEEDLYDHLILQKEIII